MANRKNSWPWEFKKIEGEWHRRSSSGQGAWQRIHVETGMPPPGAYRDRGMRRRTKDVIPPAPLNTWSWK